MVLFGQLISTILSILGLRPTHLHIKLVARFITGNVWGEVYSGQGVILDNSPPSSFEVHNERSYTSSLPIRLHGVKRDYFMFK